MCYINLSFVLLFHMHCISGGKIYLSDAPMPHFTEDVLGVHYLKYRMEQPNDAYAVQSTAYALLTHLRYKGSQVDKQTRQERESLVKWLISERNSVTGMASTQVGTIKIL